MFGIGGIDMVRKGIRITKSDSGVESIRSRSRLMIIGTGSLALGGILIALMVLFGAIPAASQDTQTSEVTYSRDVAPIFQNNCQSCHRPTGIAPFSLMTYEDAEQFSWVIKDYTERRIMPPWKVTQGYGEFKNERSLTQEEIDTIGRWVDAGTPEGDPEDLPPTKYFAEGWQLGTPDVILDPGDYFEVRKGRPDFFRSFVLPIKPKEDLWISAIEVVPGAPEVVHHMGIYLDPEGKSPALDKKSPGMGYPGNMTFSPRIILDFWTPGGTPRFLDPGTAWKIPAGSVIVMDIHYHPLEETYRDRTRIGLHFAEGPVDKRVRFGAVGNAIFEIPARAKRHEVTASRKIPRDIHLVSGWPHMHLLGKEMKVWATLDGSTEVPVLWAPDYDVNWQQVYVLKEPLALSRGSRLNLVAYYDNSEDNPNNPYRKPRTIRYGQRATDEMCFFYFHYTVDAEHLTQGKEVGFDALELRVGSSD
jgi:mono/diheme cytochrome c family protein